MTPKFVISLDFELHWGVFDSLNSNYENNLLGARNAVPAILEVFNQNHIRATWAVVGLLFNGNRKDYEANKPKLLPNYLDANLNPYNIEIGSDEKADPLHYAKTLVKLIGSYPGQEIGSHSYSHFYCNESGQTIHDFRADVEAAVKVAKSTLGINLQSFVFPKNQVNPDYFKVLSDLKFTSVRTNHPPISSIALFDKALRFISSYLYIDLHRKNLPEKTEGLSLVKQDRFLRPYSNGLSRKLSVRVVKREMECAAKSGNIYHLWWHPHNFGKNLDENLDGLKEIISFFHILKMKYGMRSVSMNEL